MGIFDRMYDESGAEWQTKAFDRCLDEYRVGDTVEAAVLDFQVEVIGDRSGLATVRDGVLVELPAERDKSLPLIGYLGKAVRNA